MISANSSSKRIAAELQITLYAHCNVPQVIKHIVVSLWRSSVVEHLTRYQGVTGSILTRDTPVLEQDTLSSGLIVLVQAKKGSNMTEDSLTGT